MQSGHGFSNLIYDYLITCIRFQYYREDDQLPAIDSLCRKFCVADQTVRAALRRLRAEGFISMHNGQPTKVIFRQSEKEYRDFVLHFYGERQNAYLDLLQSSRLLLTHLLTEAFSRIDENDYAFLAAYIQKAEPYSLIHFYSYIFQKLNNPLLMNLFWEVVLFEGFPILKTDGEPDLYDMQLVRKQLLETINDVREGNKEALHDNHPSSHYSLTGNIIDYIKQNAYPVSPEQQIAFTWRIYRDHPQLCYTLVSYILHAIYLGEYCKLQYLPSYEKMADHFGVSLSTMRRTIRVLNHLGAVRTINGKGTLIFKMGETNDLPDLNDTAVRRNLAYFFQAFEIMIFSCRDVTKSVLTTLPLPKRKELLEQLKDNVNRGRCDQSLWLILLLIADFSPAMMIREVYRKIYGLFLWGYPLKVYDHQNSYLGQPEIRFTLDFIHALEDDHTDLCAALVHEFALKGFSVTEHLLLHIGLHPEELRLSPTIRLLSFRGQGVPEQTSAAIPTDP